MANYSNSDMLAMKAAFAKVFNVDKEVCESPEAIKWMQDAPIAIVEYDGRFKKESSKDRDIRMELIEVYDGMFGDLINYCRRIFKEYRQFSKWEMLFKIANEISSADKLIERVKTQMVFDDNEVAITEPQKTEELPTNQSTSAEDATETPIEETKSEPTVTMAEEKPVEVTPEDGTSAPTETPVHTELENDNVPEVSDDGVTEIVDSGINDEVQSVSNTQEVANAKPVIETSEQPTGNVHEAAQHSLSNTNNIKPMEETKMENDAMKAMMAAAQMAGGAADPAQAQTAPSKSNAGSADKAKNNENIAAVAQILGDEKNVRNAWTRQNVVTSVVSTQKPAALRTLSDEGTPTSEAEQEKALEKINENIAKFVVGVSGRKGCTVEQFAGLTDEEKYANVYGSTAEIRTANVIKAKEMYNLLMQIKQNPLAPIKAFIPGADKVSYATKGYAINGRPLPIEEFIVELLDNGMGIIYGEGSMSPDGNDVGDKPVTFKVGIAKVTEKNQSSGIAVTATTKKVPTVRPKNKKEFIRNGQNVVFLFDKLAEGENAQGTASFKAAIQGQDGVTNAVVPVYALDENGNRIAKEKKTADAETTYKTKMVSINCSVPVTKVVKEIGDQFKNGDVDTTVTAARWNINLTVARQSGNFGNVGEISQAPGMDVFALIYGGGASLSSTLKKSGTIAKLQAAANEEIAADAKQAAEDLV